MTSKVILGGLIALAFVAGTIATGSMATAQQGEQGNGLQQSIQALTTQVMGLETDLIAEEAARIQTDQNLQDQINTSNSGNLVEDLLNSVEIDIAGSLFGVIIAGDEDTILYYGDSLCGIDITESFKRLKTIMVVFGGDTIVGFDQPNCSPVASNIVLDPPEIFQKGDFIVLEMIENEFPVQVVFKQQIP